MNTLRTLMTGILMLMWLITVPVIALAALDTTQPTTSATLTGTKGSDGWYTTSVTMTLAAADGTDGSGVAKTEYSLDNVTWLTYSVPFVLDKDGDQYVYFRSTDLTGNVETPAKAQNIKINKTGLVGWWKMDGDWKDASVVGNSGTPFNGTSFSPDAKVGTQACSFDGINDYASIPDSPTLNPGKELTVSGWIKVNAFDKTWQSVFWKGNTPDCTTGCENRGYGLWINSSSYLHLASTPQDGIGVGQRTISTAPGAIQLGAWTHFAAVISSTNDYMKIYINGQELATGPYSTSGIRTTSGPLIIGNVPNLSATFNGLIDEVSIYNRALSITDIQTLYHNFIVNYPVVNSVPTLTNSANISLSGTKPANTAIVVNGNTFVPLDAATSWHASYTLSEGINSIAITAQDSQKLNSVPVVLTVTLDSTPPTAPKIDPVAAPINTTTRTITGSKSSDSASVAVNCSGATIDTISYPTATTWSVTVSGLSEGGNTIAASAVDAVGNLSGTTTAKIIVDTTSPSVGATPAEGIYASAQSVVLTANEQSAIYYTLDGSTPTVSAMMYSQPIPIPTGATLKYFARDLAGNTSEIKTEKYVIDTTPPVLTVSTLSDGAFTNNEILNIAGTVTDDTEVKGVTVNDVPVPVNTDGSFSYALVLKSGTNVVTTVATDRIGNRSSDTRSINLDQTAPALLIATPADNSKAASALLTVSGVVDETSSVLVRHGDTVQSAIQTGNAFSAYVTLVSGYNTIEITAADLAGNQSSLKRTVLYDDEKPSLAIIDPNQDMRTNQGLTIKGTVHDTLTAVGVTISKDNEIFTPQVIDGKFEQTLNFAEEKTYDIVVTATNEVGTSTSVQRNIIYDITPPALGIDPITSPTSQQSLSVTGIREAGTPVAVTCATATVSQVSYPSATTWRVNISGLKEGENVVTAASADAAGNVFKATATVVLISKLPEITIAATPDVIWPPNHKMVPVTITGGVETNGSVIKSVAISVSDEYKKFEYNNLTFGSTVMLEAWRKGNDKDGRKYTITVVVTDMGGGKTVKTALVTVPHDKPKLKKTAPKKDKNRDN